MDDRTSATQVYERLSALELRMKVVENKLESSSDDVRQLSDDLKRELSRQSEDLALTRQAVRIFEDVARGLESQLRLMATESVDRIRGIAAENKEMLEMLHDHKLKDASDKSKMLVGVVTASGAGLASLGILIWGVMLVVAK